MARRCPVCRSKQWRKDPSSGLLRCSEGHVLQGYRNETHEVTEMTMHTMKKRAVRVKKDKIGRPSRANPALYHGARARFHQYQCLQLLLRKQIAALAKLWRLPAEFEAVCRETWAMHLSLLRIPPPPEPLLYAQDFENDRSGTENEAKPSIGKQEDVDQSHLDHSSHSSASENESDDDEMNIQELLRENSETESSESEEEDHNADVQGPGEPAAAKRKNRSTREDHIVNTIAVLVLACWMSRIPVMYCDFIRLIDMGDLPYLDAVRLLPESLTLHLTKHTKQSLSPKFAPTTLRLHGVTSRLARNIRVTYGIFTPQLSAAPVLWRILRQMNGNAMLYVTVNSLARQLDLTLALHPTLAPSLPRVKHADPSRHRGDNVPPEVALVAVLVVVLKLLYGLDGKERLHSGRWDPIFAMPQLSDYMEGLRQLDEREACTPEHAFSPASNVDITEWDETLLDSYIVFCEKALIGNARQQKDGSDPVEMYFPMGRRSEIEGHGHIDHVGPSAQGVAVAQNSMTAYQTRAGFTGSAGSGYVIYKSQDVLGGVPLALESVVARCSRLVGVDTDDIFSLCEHYERRLARHWDDDRRRRGSAGSQG